MRPPSRIGRGRHLAAQFDQHADHLLERLRGNPTADAVFVTASELGDFSLLWHIVGVARAATGTDTPGDAAQLAAAIGMESLLVNQGVKRLFRRVRPTEAGDVRYPVRTPSTSSFPSGHASSAFFAATLLVGRDGARSAPIWFGVAAVVATSRSYVRIHYASDVVAGAALGVALGVVARRALVRLGSR